MQLQEQSKNTRSLDRAQRPADLHGPVSLLRLPATESSQDTSLHSVSLPGVSRAQRYRIPLPSWLLSKSFEIVFEQMGCKIDFGLRCYNVVPTNSAIYMAVCNDDIGSVKHLFETKQASPFDIPASGESLLHRAIGNCSFKMCKLLVQQGTEILYGDQHGRSILLALSSVTALGPDPGAYNEFRQNIEEMIELLIKPLDFDNQEHQEFEAEWAKSPVLAPWAKLVLKGGISKAGQLAFEDRAKLFLDCVECTSADMAEDLLGQDLAPDQAFAYARNAGFDAWDLLTCILHIPEDSFGRWISIGQHLVHYVQSLVTDYPQHLNQPVKSILGFTLYKYQYSAPELHGESWSICTRVNQELRYYLSRLQLLGADLACFVQREQIHFRHHLCQTRTDTPWKVTRLDTGTRITDWKIWMVPSGWEYEWAGEFWHWIENPELYIPGAFPVDIPC